MIKEYQLSQILLDYCVLFAFNCIFSNQAGKKILTFVKSHFMLANFGIFYYFKYAIIYVLHELLFKY